MPLYDLGLEDFGPIIVQTRAGTRIRVSQASTLQATFRAGDKIEHGKHPNAVPRTQEISGFFNCHGLVFASRRAAIDEVDQMPMILKEDGYTKVPVTDILPGDVAIYYDLTNGDALHSAVVVDCPQNHAAAVMVVSKWGYGREYRHALNDCPYQGRIEFYRILK
jgi:hypothetical protein